MADGDVGGFDIAPFLSDLGDPQTGAMTGAPTSAGGFFRDPGAGGGGFNIQSLLPALIPAATGLFGYFKGQGGAGDKAIKAQTGATGPAQTVSNQQLNAYAQGKMTPYQEADVEQFRKQSQAKWQQYFANAGIPISSAQADINNKVDLDTLAYKNKIMQQNVDSGYRGAALTASNLTNVAREQMAMDAAQRQQWEQFMAQLAKVGGDIFGGQGGVMSEQAPVSEFG